MTETRIKISSIVENQLPQFVREEFPLVSEFLSQYYISLESQSGVNDLLQNIDQYIKVDQLTNLIDYTVLTSDVTYFDSTINVISTSGFPDEYGLLLIDSEIITYTSKTSTTFEGCVRGFSGTTSYEIKDEFVFTETEVQEHSFIVNGAPNKVTNLSILFLKEFLNKVKKQITPGFDDRELYSDLDERLFIKQSIDFYSSKGTDNSFKILFGALYGQNVEVIRPRDYLIQPSDAQYRITSDLVVESIEGNPEDIVNRTLYQDQTSFISSAQGTITKVERIRRDSKDYYVISLDSDYNKDIGSVGSIFGKFTIHPKTKLISNIVSGSTTLEVDSTVAFPQNNGNLIIDLENGTSLFVTYKSKNLNQFLGCSGISQDILASTEVKSDFFAYGNSSDGIVKIRILGVLSELELPTDTKLYSKGDTVKIKTLGIDLNDYKSNNWFFNIPVKYDVKSIHLLDISDKSYKVDLYYTHSLRVGDYVTLISSTGREQSGYVVSFNNEKSFSIQFGSENLALDVNLSYIARKNLSKVSSDNYPSVNQYISNVQNVYYSNNKSLYVTSPSLPTYLNRNISVSDRSITFSGSFDGEILDFGSPHGFYTGDSIVYKPTTNNTLGISTGVYFAKKESETKLKLARSRSNIFTNNFITVSGIVTNAKFELTDFTYGDLSTQLLESQKLIRKISEPETDSNVYETIPGLTGIFVNGVELLNYKSKDNVYYGPIENIIPIAPGSGYDVINPPILSIIDPVGAGASGYCSVIGSLNRIDIIDAGFDYVEQPTIEIVGGNGYGASAKANLISFDHTSSFNSQGSAKLVELNPINTIGFSDYHKFRDLEEVVYITDSQIALGGLFENSTYFVSVQDAYNIKLHKSFYDASVGINTVELTSYGVGNHTFKSRNKKKKIGSITVQDAGIGYQNKLTSTEISGISTTSDIITISNHGYNSGEIVVYNATLSPIGGLSSSTSYYVTRINSDQFKLSQIGINTLGISTTFYYESKQYVDLTSVGAGVHKFNYPEIKVSVSGRIGVSTISNQNFGAIIQPVFSGEIQSVFVESGGEKYGSEDILNYNRQPLFELNSGSGIQLKPIISQGKIVDVLINSSGSGYNSVPNIEIIGDGIGASLTPIFSNGSLSEIKIINGGIGYNPSNTYITVTSSGYGAKFEAQIKPWKINLVERLIQNSQIPDDDGILTSGLNGDYGLEYTHAYSPRNLRSSVQASFFKEGEKLYVPDLQLFNNKEQLSYAHSPIIGWAYDGNPIYGPYGYSSKLGGSVKAVRTGYKLSDSVTEDRPKTSLYPKGFFVEDYVYVGNGDLDEHNGRFCITPEYPNGIYAYFSTINGDYVESSGMFMNYRRPIFPYVLGNSYKSKPIEFNFNRESNQDHIDINQTDWRRNTKPYGILDNPNSYEFLLNPNNIKLQNSTIKSVSTGSIDFIKIISPGNDYKVNNKINFDSLPYSDSDSARAKVSLISGKLISQISVGTSIFDDVKFYPSDKEFIGFTSVPHNYSNNDLITITGEYDYQKSANISVSNNTLTITSGVGSAQYTGLVTYFSVSGNLNYPNIGENDIYQIGNEQVKILNVDAQSSRIRVLRNQNNTSGIVTYTAGSILKENPRKFKVNFGISTSYNYEINREFYFDPKESVGLGTTSGVGIVSTIYFSNPGVGITQSTIPTQSIYIRNHNLNTGDSVIYSANGGSRISVSTNGYSSFQLTDNSIVYVAKITNDLIGLSTNKISIGSTGTFVSAGSTPSNILYFTSVGSGNTHSFKTNYTNTLTGQISKNVVTVSTAETHGLSLRDEVFIDVKSGLSTTFVVKYDDYNRRLLVNPREFSSIDLENNIITIDNHGYYTGQKVLYTSDTPATGLLNESCYYIVTIDPNKIKLSDSYYKSTKKIPEVINITSSTPGTISPINPPLKVIRNQNVIFDLSDPSLSFVSNYITYPAFDFKIYLDEKFAMEFDSTFTSPIFEVSKTGEVGIDSTAKVVLSINQNVPGTLYYNLIPVNTDLNLDIKKEIFADSEVISSNKISIVESGYNGKYTITEVSPTSFKYNIPQKPELYSYTDNAEYYTNSLFAKGPIKGITLQNGGKNYNSLPGITSISSNSGYGCILEPVTTSIGKITSTEIQDIGFNYSADYSVRPTAKLPDIFILDSLSSFESIGITSFGRNYNSVPKLVVVDGLTNKVISDVNLTYSFGDSQVTILKNNSSLSNVAPKIIPTNNSNGIKINNIQFNPSSKDVVVTLGASFSDPEDFPFFIGEKVLIEGISVGIATTARGYNSSNYDYSVFTLTGVTTALGGIGATVSYNLSSYLEDGQIPGTFNTSNSSGKIVPQSHFPIFSPVLKKNDFYTGEVVYSTSSTGNVEYWDSINQYLKVSTVDTFVSNDTIIGKSSGSVAIIKGIISYDADYKIDSSSPNRKGWNTETGFLNNDFQRIHDSDYYQYFSYSLKSQKDFSTWDNPVSSLNHTAGFKKFSNLIIESEQSNSGILTDQNNGDFSGTANLYNFVDLNCVFDFDLARENNLTIDQNIKSDEIILNSRVIQDYIESIGNRVLTLDNISDQFNSNPRPTEFSVVDSFPLNDARSKKYIISIQDKKILDEKQITAVSLIYDGYYGFLNQYGVQTLGNLGSFDFNISGSNGNLLFYPIKSKFNDYYLNIFSFALNDVVSGISTINLGNSAYIHTNTVAIAQGSSTANTIVGIASTYRSSKILVQIGSTTSSYCEYDEITYIHDENEVYFLDYGQLSTNSISSRYSSGIGTYNAYISGSEIKIDLIPNDPTSENYTVNTFNISLSNGNVSGVGTETVGGSSINSSSLGIGSSNSPIPNIIASYSNLDYISSYLILSIEDKTNLQYQISEILVLTNSDECYLTEFGVLQTNSILGVTTAGISGNKTNIYFTPIENIEVDVKVFLTNIGLSDEVSQISLNKGSVNYSYGEYVGSNNDIKKQFNLTHQNLPIFQRYFKGNDSNIVNINSNTIRIPNHFYVTGEEIEYSYKDSELDTTKAIGIATTSISGIGITDKLPSSLYVVKVNDLDIRVASSASNALKTIPNVLDITSVGIGSSHLFTSKNQNEKVIIGIDNLIQSPIVSTAITSTLTGNISVFSDQIFVSGISSIYGGDFIKIDSEIMKVTSVGVGSTNAISVLRPWFGSRISSHTSSTLVTKIQGNYNIVDNILYFSEAPYGKVPFVNLSNRGDEEDYAGIVTGSTFSGRVFLRSGLSGSNEEAYEKNYIFDDISKDFNGKKNTFTLKSNGQNISGISTDNCILLINNIFQGPDNLGDYTINENAGISSVSFTGTPTTNNYDVNTSSIPRGGIILSVGSSQGFGYQPLVSAGGTAIVSAAGTIQSISIGNSGSGYRSGIQKTINVGVKTESTGIPNVQFIGTATVSNGYIVGVSITNPGIGYTSTNPPIVIFDAPLSYSNVPLIYSSKSSSGLGTGAIVDIVVGQGSSIISFELKNLGYGYNKNEILTVSIGGTTGIPTTSSPSFSEFEIFVDDIASDNFSAWSIGNLQIIDSIDSLFDDKTREFPIIINGNQTTIRSKKGSNIDVQATLLVFLNDVLQVPGQGYTFRGGSTLIFAEAPKVGDRSKLLFYKGTGDVDTQNVDVLESIKIGDIVTLSSDNIDLIEYERLVSEIVSSDIMNTNLYDGPGISQNEDLYRPLSWCRQTEDLVVNGKQVAKDRIIYESYIQPSTNIIRNISVGSTVFFVESVKTFFDSEGEYLHNGTNEKPQNKIIIISQDSIVSASATVVVSSSGTISSVNITDNGVGYTTSPSISISNPIGIGSTGVAVFNSSIINGSVSSIEILNGGFGYDQSLPPSVLFESPASSYEVLDNVSYEGDFGIITGISTVSVGVASTGIAFDFFIPLNSTLRNKNIVKVGIATTGISGIQTGYYFVINKSNVGKGVTSLDSSQNVVGVGTSFIDNIYQVASVSIAQTSVAGVGITNVAKVIVSVSGYNNLTGLGFSGFYGEYSWGKISSGTRTSPKEFVSYANSGGISTSPIIQRFNRLKYIGYSTT
jgi:hypothetical protein